jgi:hypothetical protein
LIKISAPEFLIVSSCAVFISGQTLVGGIFLTLGVVGASIRLAVEAHNRSEEMTHKKDVINITMSIVNSLFSSLSTVVSSIGSSISEDRDINEEDYN